MSLFTVSNTATTHPLKVRLSINGKPITIELDTGAAVSVISDKILHSCFPEAQVSKSDMVLKTYTGECMRVIGEWRVNVQYQDGKPHQLNLVVIKGNSPILLGRNWLQRIHLDWPIKALSQVPNRDLPVLLDHYKEVFTDELGTIKQFNARLSIADSAKPKFCKPRPVPFALRDAVEHELDTLLEAEVVEKVNFSEWAAPIVVVPKKDHRVRICGDYKVTINPVIEVD